jgi:3-deoxy-D-manno-octulosonic-acid transferase
MRWFYKGLLTQCDRIFCQSADDMARFIALGAHNVEVLGNIKLAQKIVATKSYIKPDCTLIVAGSTHEGEEEAIVRGFVAYKKHNAAAKLLVVPRHPERFEKVFALIQKIAPESDLVLWSESQALNSDITLVDAMGELNNLYAISDVAILGGAFAPIGGHNPLEPAKFGCKIITGEHIFSQRELFKYVHHVQFIVPQGVEQALISAEGLPPSTVDETIDVERIIDYLKMEIKS